MNKNTVKTVLIAGAILCAPVFMSHAIADHHGDKSGRFSKMDSNGDGKISYDEHLQAAKERFSHMDADGDGFVTKEEAQALKKKMKDKIKEKRDQKKSQKGIE